MSDGCPPGRNDYGNYNTSIIRPKIHIADIRVRGEGEPPARLRQIRRGLLTLHTLELMAVNIYRFQITSENSNLNFNLIAAMCNEMTHLQDFLVKLYEYGFRPGKFRGLYWMVGMVLGLYSRLRGPQGILKMGIWVETKAVEHYQELLSRVEWDEDTRRIIEKNQADEYSHVTRWRTMLQSKEMIDISAKNISLPKQDG